jgi:hypothetical protein
MKKVFILLWLGLLSSGTAIIAQQDNIWTLEECINYALEQNITVRKGIYSDQRSVQGKIPGIPEQEFSLNFTP